MTFKNKFLLIICILLVITAISFVVNPKSLLKLSPNIKAPSLIPLDNTPAIWQIYSSSTSDITFKYPSTLSATFVGLVDWPPRPEISEQSFSCNESGDGPEAQRTSTTYARVINGRTYCVSVTRRGAAGTIYDQYSYSTLLNTKVVTLTFSIHHPQCDNYADQKIHEACQKETIGFSDQLDQTINQIFSTLTFS